MLTKRRDKHDLIGGTSLFAACNRKEVSRIASMVDELRVPAGSVLTKEGQTGAEFFVIASGRAEATLRGEHLAFLEQGSFFGEMSLLDHGPRAATVVAETDLTLFVLDPRNFTTLLEDTPAVARKVMRGLAERLRDVERAPTH